MISLHSIQPQNYRSMNLGAKQVGFSSIPTKQLKQIMNDLKLRLHTTPYPLYNPITRKEVGGSVLVGRLMTKDGKFIMTKDGKLIRIKTSSDKLSLIGQGSSVNEVLKDITTQLRDDVKLV